MSGEVAVTTSTAKAETFADRWRKAWPVIVVVIAYMIPLFWLWNQTGFPDSLGVHIVAHGRTGLLENLWYSYLLLHRHRIMDVVTFTYMWAAVAGIVVWVGWVVLKDRRRKRAISNRMMEKSDAA